MDKDIEVLIRKYALANAVEHNGKCMVGSVVGKVISQMPVLKEDIMELKPFVEKIVPEINNMSLEEQKMELIKLGWVEEKVMQKKEEKKLPDISENIVKNLVTRFAPNPNGSMHLGHSRVAILPYEYVKKYKGKFLLRFEDTDPKVKKAEKINYKWLKEDLKWLGIKWSKVYIQSKRLKVYYKYAERLLKLHAAYLCECKPDIWKQHIDEKRPCPCRSLTIEENLKRWKRFIGANKNPKKSYKEGQVVLRIKTDMEHPNPAIRDWPAMRIVDKPSHPFSKLKVWPLYNFSAAIDDHEMKVTLILRGQEHATNETKQRYLYNYFSWDYPKVMVQGRLLFPGLVLSKSQINKGIEEGIYDGWEDPKLGTIRALKRRGFSPEAIRNFILDIGAKSSDATVAFENLAAFNKKVVDEKSNRYFFVNKPVEINIDNNFRKVILDLNPSNHKKKRILIAREKLLLSMDDVENGKEARLIGLGNIYVRTDASCNVVNDDLEYAKQKHLKKIHWLPNDNKQIVKAEVILPDSIAKGYIEKNVLKEKVGNVVQLERFGFCRLEKISKNKVVAVFGHK
ncbi:MAG: glutamate--tRNA ligase [Candidatus Aenigmarchaeota archaeon]|nr:glutamate--tRNA ligase [Candidatus Aenigmarchaeota archaeon]